MTAQELRPLVKRLFGLARFCGATIEDAEDIAAEVVCRMTTGKIQHEGGAITAVKRLVIDQQRLHANRYTDSLEFDMEMGGMNEPATSTDFTEIEVEDFLSKLPPNYAEALRLQMQEDAPDRVQAEMLGISEAAYKTRLWRARDEARYRVYLAQWVEG